MLLEEFKEMLNIAEAGLFEKFETAFHDQRSGEGLDSWFKDKADTAFILERAFSWDATKEGYYYWKGVCTSLEGKAECGKQLTTN